MLRIGPGRDITRGFVQENVAKTLGRSDTSAVDPNVIDRRIRLGAHRSYGFAIDRHTSFGDELFRRATGGEAGLRENFLKTLRHGRRAG